MAPRRVLHAYNEQRGGGGAGIAAKTTIRALRQRGLEVHTFERDSRSLPAGLSGKLQAFAGGLYAREAVQAFGKLLDQLQPDLVHAHELYPLISPWVLRECGLRGVPVVMSAYDYRLSCPTHNHFSHGEVCTRCLDSSEWACVQRNCRGNLAESVAYAARNRVARHFDLFRRNVAMFITPTRFSADWLVAHAGIAADRIRAVPCAVELAAQGSDPALGSYVAYAGRMVSEKGITVLTEAVRIAGLPLALAVGTSEQLPPSSHQAEGTRYLQTHDRGALNDFFRAARFLVVPSIWFETGPLVVGEAMGHGLPVIASNIGALSQMVSHEQTGLLFNTGDPADLAAKMRRLWDDPALCRQLGAAARQHALATVSEQAHTDAVLQVYHEVLAGQAA